MKLTKLSGTAQVHLSVPFSSEEFSEDSAKLDEHYLESNLDHFLSKQDLIKYLNQMTDQDFYSLLGQTTHDEITLSECEDLGRALEHPLYDDDE